MISNFKPWIFLLAFAVSSTAFAQSSDDFVLRQGLRMPYIADGETEGLKVMWWNIGCSSTRGLKKMTPGQRAQVDPVHQWLNLKKLIESDFLKPDVLILGEYCPGSFNQSTYNSLSAVYPHILRVKKSNALYKVRNGFRVFSKYKIQNKNIGVLNAENFVDSQNMKDCTAGVKKRNKTSFKPKFWNRPEISFSVKHNEKVFNIVPVHLANPWRILKACIGRFGVGFEIIGGVENANYVQASTLVDRFSDKEKTLLIGDFNAPKSIVGSQSNGYHVMAENFGESIVRSGEATFLDPLSSFGNWSLDHAFISRDLNVEKGVVVPFAGSDHLPIYVIVNQ